MELILLFIVKLIDQALTTTKSIFVAKGRYLIGAVLNAICTSLYFILIVKVTQSDGIMSIIVVSIASFIGTYLSGTLIKKSEPDKLFIFRVTPSSLESGKQFADEIRNNNLAIHTTVCYDKDMNKNLFCEIYCKTKEESKTVMDLIPGTYKYHIQNPI